MTKAVVTEAGMQPSDYLSRPYQRCVVPDTDGSFRAEIIEFPGCVATGDTAIEALTSVEAVAESWLAATLSRGMRVPEPMENTGFSGKLVLRLPKTLHRKAAHAAARDGVSLNQFISTSIAESVGEKTVLNQTNIDNRMVVYQYKPTQMISNSAAYVSANGMHLTGSKNKNLPLAQDPAITFIDPLIGASITKLA